MEKINYTPKELAYRLRNKIYNETVNINKEIEYINNQILECNKNISKYEDELNSFMNNNYMSKVFDALQCSYAYRQGLENYRLEMLVKLLARQTYQKKEIVDVIQINNYKD